MFHGCLCDECERLYGYVGVLPSGKQVVCGRCSHGCESIRDIERVLEAHRRLRERGEEVTAQGVSDELDAMYHEEWAAERERQELSEYRRLKKKFAKR